jgi:hypothetical protein
MHVWVVTAGSNVYAVYHESIRLEDIRNSWGWEFSIGKIRVEGLP